MKCIFLVTHKLNKTKTVSVTNGEKDIFALYSPRENLIELLEKVDDNLLDYRLDFWKEQHVPKFIVKPTPEPKPPKKKKRKKYRLSAKARRERSKRMKLNNPNKDGWRPSQREKMSERMKGNQYAKGKTRDEETKKWYSFLRSQQKPNLGKKWIHNPYTKEERFLDPGQPMPPDFRYGRNPEFMEELMMQKLAKQNYKGGW